MTSLSLPEPLAAMRGAIGRHRRAIGWAVNLAVLGFIGWQVWQLGIGAVMNALPANPLFYGIYLLHFAATPFAERRIFALMWPGERLVPWRVLLRKRTMNAVLISYSGDLWFYLWARARTALTDRRILSSVKDSTILSGIAAAAGTGLMTVWAVATGGGETIRLAIGDHVRAAVIAGVVALFALPMMFRLRGAIFGLATRLIWAVLGWHVARLVATQILQAWQWAVAMPQVPFELWLLLLTVQLVVLQIPLVPNADLIFLAVGVRLTGELGVDRAQLTALLLATSVFKQIVNLGTLAITSMITPAQPDAEPQVDRGDALPEREEADQGRA